MNEIKFSKEELERYSRQLIIPEFNIEGQKKLKNAKVLLVGAGGLGSPVLQYLVAAGVGQIGIVDDDFVSASNLQRQLLFDTDDIGKPKVEVAVKNLAKLNENVRLVPYALRISNSNARDIASSYDLIVDGTDNFPTRYLLNDLAVLLNIPYVYGSIYRFEGQVSVFNYPDKDGSRGPNYRDLFPEPPAPHEIPSCAEGGVLGVLPGIIGSMQAVEAVKIITGIGEVLSGRLFLFNALNFTSKTIKIEKDQQQTEIKELIEYDQFCGLQQDDLLESSIKHISVEELRNWMNEQVDFQLIDVREPYEYEIANIQGQLIPQKQILQHLDEIATDKKVVFHCRTGKRSAEVIELLEEVKGLENLYNLQGGISEWTERIDTSLPKY